MITTYRKIKRLQISERFFEFILAKGEKRYKVVDASLPNNVRVIDIVRDYRNVPVYWFILGHESWPELQEGDEIPIIDSPIYEKF